jgi:hypothetical protein
MKFIADRAQARLAGRKTDPPKAAEPAPKTDDAVVN